MKKVLLILFFGFSASLTAAICAYSLAYHTGNKDSALAIFSIGFLSGCAGYFAGRVMRNFVKRES